MVSLCRPGRTEVSPRVGELGIDAHRFFKTRLCFSGATHGHPGGPFIVDGLRPVGLSGTHRPKGFDGLLVLVPVRPKCWPGCTGPMRHPDRCAGHSKKLQLLAGWNLLFGVRCPDFAKQDLEWSAHWMPGWPASEDLGRAATGHLPKPLCPRCTRRLASISWPPTSHSQPAGGACSVRLCPRCWCRLVGWPVHRRL